MINYTFKDFGKLAYKMQEIVHNDVKHHQSDLAIDISDVATAIDEGNIPEEAFWITRKNGTYLGFNDERIIDTLLANFVDTKKDNLLDKSGNEHCYRIDFVENDVFEVEPIEFVFMVNAAMKNAKCEKKERLIYDCEKCGQIKMVNVNSEKECKAFIDEMNGQIAKKAGVEKSNFYKMPVEINYPAQLAFDEIESTNEVNRLLLTKDFKRKIDENIEAYCLNNPYNDLICFDSDLETFFDDFGVDVKVGIETAKEFKFTEDYEPVGMKYGDILDISELTLKGQVLYCPTFCVYNGVGADIAFDFSKLTDDLNRLKSFVHFITKSEKLADEIKDDIEFDFDKFKYNKEGSTVIYTGNVIYKNKEYPVCINACEHSNYDDQVAKQVAIKLNRIKLEQII